MKRWFTRGTQGSREDETGLWCCCPASNPSSTAYRLCDLGQMPEPFWAWVSSSVWFDKLDMRIKQVRVCGISHSININFLSFLFSPITQEFLHSYIWNSSQELRAPREGCTFNPRKGQRTRHSLHPRLKTVVLQALVTCQWGGTKSEDISVECHYHHRVKTSQHHLLHQSDLPKQSIFHKIANASF